MSSWGHKMGPKWGRSSNSDSLAPSQERKEKKMVPIIKIESSLNYVMKSLNFLKFEIAEIENDVSGRRSVPEVFY